MFASMDKLDCIVQSVNVIQEKYVVIISIHSCNALYVLIEIRERILDPTVRLLW